MKLFETIPPDVLTDNLTNTMRYAILDAYYAMNLPQPRMKLSCIRIPVLQAAEELR